MKRGRESLMGAGLFVAMPLCLLLVAGCSQPNAPASAPSGPPPGGGMSGPGGGPGGPGGGPGGPGGGPRGGGPVAANASGAEIYQSKCGCHGPDGKGKRAPALTDVSTDSDSKLIAIIHDGKDKMPAFGSQLSDDQIKKVVAYIKGFKAGS
ncbi:MAG: cytochrome c, class [Chthonomonadaceae bacterium]|nr:cytochrome c, class [Chthonomonadaceae bacterium]